MLPLAKDARGRGVHVPQRDLIHAVYRSEFTLSIRLLSRLDSAQNLAIFHGAAAGATKP